MLVAAFLGASRGVASDRQGLSGNNITQSTSNITTTVYLPVIANGQPGGLAMYSDPTYGFALLYPADMVYQRFEPEPEAGILASTGFFYPEPEQVPGVIPEGIAVTVFDNPTRADVVDWATERARADLSDLPPGLSGQAVFEKAGDIRVFEPCNGLRCVLFPERWEGMAAGRLLIGMDRLVVGISYTDFGAGLVQSTFSRMAATFSPSRDGAPRVNPELEGSLEALVAAFPRPLAQESDGEIEVQTPAAATGYMLPWNSGTSWKVTQGWGTSYDGKRSHNTRQMYYAYDFTKYDPLGRNITEGQALRASRGGTVSAVERRYTGCSSDKVYYNLANRVTISHTDGTATLYLHLKDVYVSQGAVVKRGDVIGTAGKTGYTGCFAHLHFQRQAQGIWITDSRVVYFDEYPRRVLASGSTYASRNVSCPYYYAEYYNNRTLDGNPTFTRCEGWPVNFTWAYGGPGNGVGNDNFSVRWRGGAYFAAGVYRFTVRTDDGIRLWFDSALIIDKWFDQGPTTHTATRTVSAGYHDIMIEYYENGGYSVAFFRWDQESGNLALNRTAYATSQESSSYVAARGNDGNMGTRWSSRHSSSLEHRSSSHVA